MTSKNKVIEELKKEVSTYKAILDAVPFPVHVTDANMKWMYMNKSFESLLMKEGAIKDRESAYGSPCSNARADICKTENCGIRKLREQNIGETYFDWFGAKCKQYTATIKDPAGKQTGYVEIVTDLTSILRVNEYANAEITRLSKDLDMIANGNLNINLEVTPADEHTQEIKGMFAKANGSLKSVVDSLSTLNGEAEKLAKAGKSGDLDVRGDESRLKGVYAQIIHGVNDTFDSIKAPLDVASAYIEKMANGYELELLENPYQGYYSVLIDNLNQVRAALYALLGEAMKLSEAGKNGDLNQKANASLVKGNYSRILDEFNQILDSIAVPLNESFTVLKKFASNDYTSQMSENYNGMIKEFAVSINSVRAQLLAIEKVFLDISEGDMSLLEQYKKIGRRSENDHLIPAIIVTMQSVKDISDISYQFANSVADGNFAAQNDLAATLKGGYRQIGEQMNRALLSISAPIKEASDTLQAFAQGDLTVAVTGEYKGEYNLIKQSLNQAIASFNSLLGDIHTAANQVALGATQISDASQSLSQGATEQASSIEELTASISEVASQTKQNAMDAAKASLLSSEVQSEAVQGNEKMKQMLDSMKEINESSANISKIIKAIDDIAFQINILALNAAIEAARAGQYGKGFAVVAEEVRNLAGKSAEAAKDTAALVEESIHKVENGTKTANETADKLMHISENLKNSVGLVGHIASASNEQATAIAQINQGVVQVSTVVQTNSATAEESAASSEELSGQANMLSELAGKFKLKSSH